MHFAYPPRKSSNPPPFRPKSSRVTALRRGRMKTVGLIGLGFLFLLYILLGRSESTPTSKAKHVPSGSPPVVMVTVFNSEHGLEYKNTIKDNRNNYAQMHGYETFFAHIGDYDLHGAPMSWTRVVAMRHALTKFPDASYVWFLGQDSLIMDPKISIHRHIMGHKNIDQSMLRSQPVALPESIIKTSRQLAPDQVELALTQDKAGMSPESLILKNGEFAEFFLDTWYDPLFRSYNFKKAELHALEHIVQWHSTILAKMAILPQRMMNGYSRPTQGEEYQDGDFVVRFAGCTKSGEKSCQEEALRYSDRWRKAFEAA